MSDFVRMAKKMSDKLHPTSNYQNSFMAAQASAQEAQQANAEQAEANEDDAAINYN